MGKNTFFIVAAILVLAGAALAVENHVRWNPNLNECVYFYTPSNGTSAHCYVDEEHCPKDGQNHFKDVDASTCYYVPRSQNQTCAEFVEGDLIVLDYQGSDPDENIGPAGELIYTVGEPFDQNNEWQTRRGDAGTYTVEVTVSDGEFQDVDTVCFRILSGNHPPVLTASDVEVDEGQLVQLDVVCADEDGDALVLSYAGAMDSMTWRTGFDDAGVHEVTVTCKEVGSDLQDSETVTVTVNNVERPPVLEVADVTVAETDTVVLRPSCTDPEGLETVITYAGAMDSARWETGYEDAGVHEVTVTCTDAANLTDERTATVTVLDRNRPPMITAIVKRA